MSNSYVTYSSRSGLTDSDVLDIRVAAKTSSVRSVARSFATPKSTVQDIVSGKTWGHVPNPRVLNSLKNYTIYPDGRVWSNKTNKFLSTKLDKAGSLSVELVANGKRKSFSVASLVARAFSGKKSVSKVSYRDGDSTNVHFTNLVTR